MPSADLAHLEKFLRSIFVDEFVDGVTSSPPKIDLNGVVQCRTENYIPGVFLDIPKLVPPDSCLLVTASRSDSHETHDDFKTDLEQNLALLKPGGVLFTDGIIASFSRVLRLAEVQEVEKRHPDMKFEVVVHAEDHGILGLFVQRSHPNGYLNDSEKRVTFRDTATFESIEDVLARPDVKVLDPLRRKIEDFTDRLDRFRRLHRRIEAKAKEEFLARGKAALLKLASKKQRTGFSDSDEHRPSVDLSEAVVARIIIGEDATVEKLENLILDMTRIPHGFQGICSAEEEETVIQEIVRILERYLSDHAKTLRLVPKSGLIVVPGTLEGYQPGIHTVKRVGVEASEINHHCEIGKSQILKRNFSNNREFVSPEEIFLLRKKQKLLRRGLMPLVRRREGIERPIVFIDFVDCVTNRILKEKLRDLLGEDLFHQLVFRIPINFASKNFKEEKKVSREQVLDSIKEAKEKGGIVVAGGSWYDADDPYGTFHKKNICKPLFTTMMAQRSRLRILGICFSHQTMADVLGEKLFEGRIVTQPGMLEMGAVPTKITVKQHPLFFGIHSRHVTLAQTHSGHVIIPQAMKERPMKGLHVLAYSELTKLPVMVVQEDPESTASNRGRFVGMQFHPEVDVINPKEGGRSNDFRRIFEQIRGKGFEPSLREDFGDDVMDLVSRNLDEVEGRLRGNAGPHLLVNALLYLLNSLEHS